MKKILLLIIALLCTVAQGMRAQVSVWDGKSREYPVVLSWDHYAIRNAAHFAWLSDHAGDVSIHGYTFWLETDLDMGDKIF